MKYMFSVIILILAVALVVPAVIAPPPPSPTPPPDLNGDAAATGSQEEGTGDDFPASPEEEIDCTYSSTADIFIQSSISVRKTNIPSSTQVQLTDVCLSSLGNTSAEVDSLVASKVLTATQSTNQNVLLERFCPGSYPDTITQNTLEKSTLLPVVTSATECQFGCTAGACVPPPTRSSSSSGSSRSSDDAFDDSGTLDPTAAVAGNTQNTNPTTAQNVANGGGSATSSGSGVNSVSSGGSSGGSTQNTRDPQLESAQQLAGVGAALGDDSLLDEFGVQQAAESNAQNAFANLGSASSWLTWIIGLVVVGGLVGAGILIGQRIPQHTPGSLTQQTRAPIDAGSVPTPKTSNISAVPSQNSFAQPTESAPTNFAAVLAPQGSPSSPITSSLSSPSPSSSQSSVTSAVQKSSSGSSVSSDSFSSYSSPTSAADSLGSSAKKVDATSRNARATTAQPVSASPELMSYITSTSKSGFTKQAIVAELLHAGWLQSEIDTAFVEFASRRL